jgi:hypothetical protein
VTFGNQTFCERAADEPGRAGDNRVHRPRLAQRVKRTLGRWPAGAGGGCLPEGPSTRS